jgi:hypothetical protein
MSDPKATYVDDGGSFWKTPKGKKALGTSIAESILNKIENNAALNGQDIKAVQQFLMKNRQTLISGALAEGTDPSGKSTGMAKVLLDKFYSKGGRVKAAKTGSTQGLAKQTKIENIDESVYNEMFGITSAGTPNVQNISTSSQPVKAMIRATEKILTNQALRQAKPEAVKMGEGKSRVMYSEDMPTDKEWLKMLNNPADLEVAKKGYRKNIAQAIVNEIDPADLAQMIADVEGKKRDRGYESAIYRVGMDVAKKYPGLKLNYVKSTEAGGAADVSFTLNGVLFEVEVKLDKPQYSGVGVNYNSKTKKITFTKNFKFNEQIKSALESNQKNLDYYIKRANEIGNDLFDDFVEIESFNDALPLEVADALGTFKEGDVKMGEDVQKNVTTVFDGTIDIVRELYAAKNQEYIQILNRGLFNIGNNPLKLPIPDLDGEVNVSVRIVKTSIKSKTGGTTKHPKPSNSRGMTNIRLRALPDKLINSKAVSDFTLDNASSFLKLVNTPEVKIMELQNPARKQDIKTLEQPKVIKLSEDMSMEDVLNKAASLDEALRNARDPKAPVKKIRVFDFDDTLARTKSNVLYTMPDGTTGKLTAEEFAKRGDEMLAEGAVWDFSEFNKVMDGKKGPLFEVAKKIQDARGSEDIFVLTARAPEASPAIKEFLDAIGLNIPLKNISGLGDSSPFAKSNWIVDKAAEGYNDFYFADDHAANVKAVSDAMSLMDVKSKTQLAKQNNIKFSEDSAKKMNSNFKIKDKSYVVSLFPVDNKGDYRYEFELETETGSTQAITGTGNSIRVFSTVYNGLVDAINNNKKIKRVEFSADKSEPSRVRVYTSVMDRLSKDLGWNTDIWETTDWDGGGKALTLK